MRRKYKNCLKALCYNTILLCVCLTKPFMGESSKEVQTEKPVVNEQVELNSGTILDIKKENDSNGYQNSRYKESYELFEAYCNALVSEDYEQIVSLSVNLDYSPENKKVWDTMKCYGGAREVLTTEDHALYLVVIPIEKAGISSLPEKELYRYLYIRKEGLYWYADGPLHNAYPQKKWWNGENIKWDCCDYGFSDGENGIIIESQEQLDYLIAQCSRDF